MTRRPPPPTLEDIYPRWFRYFLVALAVGSMGGTLWHLIREDARQTRVYAPVQTWP